MFKIFIMEKSRFAGTDILTISVNNNNLDI